MRHKIQFRDIDQERIFKYLLKVAQNIRPETYQKYEGRAKAVLSLPSLRAEKEKEETFKTEFKSNPEQFLVQVEFWLRTVFLKLEPEKIKLLLSIAKAEAAKAKEGNSETKEPFDFLLISMALEPEPKVYAFNKAKEAKIEKLKKVEWEDFE